MPGVWPRRVGGEQGVSRGVGEDGERTTLRTFLLVRRARALRGGRSIKARHFPVCRGRAGTRRRSATGTLAQDAPWSGAKWSGWGAPFRSVPQLRQVSSCGA